MTRRPSTTCLPSGGMFFPSGEMSSIGRDDEDVKHTAKLQSLATFLSTSELFLPIYSSLLITDDAEVIYDMSSIRRDDEDDKHTAMFIAMQRHQHLGAPFDNTRPPPGHKMASPHTCLPSGGMTKMSSTQPSCKASQHFSAPRSSSFQFTAHS
jgi:hypothetical protein